MQDYFLNIDKELGITSFDVIYKLRKILNTKKIGHSGTLDPLATGVMQVAVGKSTRLLEYLSSDKEYVATVKFGYTSTTYDNEGEKTFIKKADFEEKDLLNGIEKFRGKISQIPPKYSAIKVGGQKLCDLARNNKEMPEIKPREVEIYEIELLEYNINDEAKIRVKCSKGTYIRSIAHDLGSILGCGAYLSGLKRTQAGDFKIENSIAINEDVVNHKINPIEALNFKEYKLNEQELIKIKNGNSIKASVQAPDGEIFLLTYDNKLVSIAKLIDNNFKVEKVFSME